MSVDKILFACVSSYLLGVVLWILCHEQLWSGQARSLAETGHSSVADAQFIDYLRRSLSVLGEKQQQSQSPLPSQIESKSQGKPNGQISTLLLRYYCRAMIPIEAAVVEIQDVPFSGFIKII